ncbi:nucleotidyltransferase family protein [Aphanothece sacrum]|uniref:DNA polymerase beta domain-containing protein region n=1 Tax=Aphanothece sacrum FPU1 TaxID=1920663 RepID=A0A401IHC5_APHSA|nr:nucleotidyltransferase family protein [Aphanothece sacrum]GBF80606.1 DNA polymerase beta domain-containing protein region [Aphanothece sacrum FPU1]GBF84004.1 DNA polymerase beta domain-containing protein [Aphanothece sacrum FPU3]
MPTQENLPILLPQNKIKAFCQQYKIQKLSLFGSVLRKDFTTESDLDFLVEFLPEAKITYFDLAQMERELSLILDGRKIDLRTPAELSHYFRQEVLEIALVQYYVQN